MSCPPDGASARFGHEFAGNPRLGRPGRTLVSVGEHPFAVDAQRTRLRRLRAGVHRRLSLRDVLQPDAVRAVLVSGFGAALRIAVHAANRGGGCCWLATLPVRLLVNVPPDLQGWFLGAVYINDCAKAVLTALLLRRFLDDPIRLTSMRDLGVYLLFAVTLFRFSVRLAGRRRASASAGHSGRASSNGSWAMSWPD